MEPQDQATAPSPTDVSHDVAQGQEFDPRIILVGGMKGGTGKTTIATNLAVWLRAKGKGVLLVDTDPQCTATDWIDCRDDGQVEPRIPLLQRRGRGVAKELVSALEVYDYVVVDAGGSDSVELRAAMTVADLMLVPSQASSFDVWPLDRKFREDMVDKVQAIRPDDHQLVIKVVINRGSTNSRSKDSDAAVSLISEIPGFEVLDSLLHDRIAYQRASTEGKGVLEIDDEKAIREINNLFVEVLPHVV